MAYLDPDRAGDTTALADQLSGAAGITTFPAAAAPGNGVSIAEVLSALYEHLRPKTITGTTDIDDSVQTASTAFNILTIAPAAGAPLADVEIVLDLAKATSGFAAVESSVTVQFALARKVDGTNWRREAYQEAALSGTNAAARCQRLQAGSVGVTEQLAVFALFSGDVTADMEIPYAINYKGLAAPTVTPVAAG